jgi:hypothetical protein
LPIGLRRAEPFGPVEQFVRGRLELAEQLGNEKSKSFR